MHTSALDTKMVQAVLDSEIKQVSAAISEGYCPVHKTKMMAPPFARSMVRDDEISHDPDCDVEHEGECLPTCDQPVIEHAVGWCEPCHGVWFVGSQKGAHGLREVTGAEFAQTSDPLGPCNLRMEYYV